MFEQTFVSGSAATQRPATIVSALLFQVVGLGVLLIVPLIYVQGLPSVASHNMLAFPLPPVAPPPVVERPTVTESVVRRVTKVFIAPTVIQDYARITADKFSDAPGIEQVNSMVGGIPCLQLASACTGALGNNALGKLPEVAPPPTVVVSKPKPVDVKPIRVGGSVQQANLIEQQKPAYPALAKAARVQGVVRFEATIAKDGTIQNLHLVGGPPLLVTAAMQAVQQWRYKPTLLNGEPVEVLTTIDVNFTLSQ